MKVNNFSLNDKSGDLHLANDHAYYYQIQLQMAATKTNYCDFVVYGHQTHLTCILKESYLMKTFLKKVLSKLHISIRLGFTRVT